MNIGQSLVSVIIPVYNTEKYLSRCIKSVLYSEYKNIEIILVDDGSIDSSGLICDSFAKEDDRIRVIHKSNGGLSSARNAGIDIAKGEYITFIDSDDYIHQKYIGYLLELLQMNKCNISQCELETGCNETFTNRRIRRKETVYTINNLFKDRKIKIIACAKLYKSELFETIRFPLDRINEDEFVTYQLLYNNKPSILLLLSILT